MLKRIFDDSIAKQLSSASLYLLLVALIMRDFATCSGAAIIAAFCASGLCIVRCMGLAVGREIEICAKVCKWPLTPFAAYMLLFACVFISQGYQTSGYIFFGLAVLSQVGRFLMPKA